MERKNGEVDIIPLSKDGENLRVDTENIVTIGFGVKNLIGDIKKLLESRTVPYFREACNIALVFKA